ncbi:MAG TPA: S53 family peptidase [Candidatus Acidoferrum sp.]|jgi:kumamolisin
MNGKSDKVAVKGSAKKQLYSAQVVGEAPAGDFRVTLTIRRRENLPPVEDHSGQKPHERTYMSREELWAKHGADPADIQKVEAFAAENGLRVVRSDKDARIVVVSGNAAAFNEAFGVNLKTYFAGDRTYRGREGEILVPQELADIVTSVTGLDNRPFAKPHVRVKRSPVRSSGVGGGAAVAVAEASVSAGFAPTDLAKLYNFPTTLDGTGQTIAILELGGGFHDTEVTAYFRGLGITKPPKVTAASYPNGGTNSPGTNALDPGNPDIEVMLDIEVAGSIAPGANVVVYFAPDATDQSFLSVMSAIVHDDVNKPNVVSISWGGPEDSATGQFQTAFDDILQAAAQLGMTVCAAAGDNGSADFAADDPNWDKKAHVDFPASSPFVLACGGTQLTEASGKISSEVVWHDGANDGTGGGVSRAFPLPAYQTNAGVPPAANPAGAVMRGVPDVAGDAAPSSGYRVLCDGTNFPDASQGLPPVGGTSAVAPLWAGLVARINQGLAKPAGFLNALLYANPGGFRDITSGTNGDYKAGKGWDACTGLGTPDGTKILAALK